MPSQIAMVGLGRMGANMARRLLNGGHEVYVYNRSPEKSEELARAGATACFSLKELAAKLTPPRVIWLMLPAGPVVRQHLEKLVPLLTRGDILVDGANSYFKDVFSTIHILPFFPFSLICLLSVLIMARQLKVLLPLLKSKK